MDDDKEKQKEKEKQKQFQDSYSELPDPFKMKNVVQEPIRTGMNDLQIYVYGDEHAAMPHIHNARKLLGGLRSRNGVNTRIAAGQPGGFHVQSQRMYDDTIIQVISSNGLDILKIWPPAESKYPVPKPEPAGMELYPYMWVGVRVRYDKCRTGRQALCVNMVEPDGALLRGTVTDGFVGWAGFGDFAENPDSETREIMRKSTMMGSVEMAPNDWTVQDLLEGHHGLYGSRQPSKELRHHNFWLNNTDDEAYLICSANGLRLYSSNARSIRAAPSEKWGPWDPLMDEQQNNGQGRYSSGLELDFYDEELGLQASDLVRGWDAVFVIDGYEKRYDLEPRDERAHILEAGDMLHAAGIARGRVLPGQYMLTICAQGSDVPTSDRAGEEIEVEHDPTLYRSSQCDYRERLKTNYTPLVVEVEVRLGKKRRPGDSPLTPDMATYNFELTCADYHDTDLNVTPFGYGDQADYDECAGGPGFNPFGDNYSDVIVINPLGWSARQVSKAEVDLTPMFGGGTYKPLEGFRRAPLDIYIFGDYMVSQVDQDDYARKAGQALFKILEWATSGQFGCSEMSEASEGSLISSCSGIAKGSVWHYDPVAHKLTKLPVPEPTEEMRDDPQYRDWLGWYYPYRKQSRHACHNPIAILLQATEDFVYDTGTGFGPGDHEEVDCC